MTSEPFEQAGKLLAALSTLTGPQARGCIRLALKDGGLDAKDVTPRELSVVFKALMPKRLAGQGFSGDEAKTICEKIEGVLGTLQSTTTSTAASTMFDRLDNSRPA